MQHLAFRLVQIGKQSFGSEHFAPFASLGNDLTSLESSEVAAGTLYYRQRRTHRVADRNTSNRHRSAFFNKNGFACPGGTGLGGTTHDAWLQNGKCTVVGYRYTDPNSPVAAAPIARFGTESIDDLTGPRLITLYTGLSKALVETKRLDMCDEDSSTNNSKNTTW